MPNKYLPEFIKRLESLEKSMGLHLIESGSIQSDIKWLKWLVMGTTGGWGAILIAVVLWALKR